MSKPFRYISYGGGVQSTVLVLWAITKRIECDAVIFADTGSEEPKTYATVAAIKEMCDEAGLPFHTVTHESKGPLWEFYSGRGILPMVGVVWCTSNWKIAPIRRKVRELADCTGPKPWAEALLGITTDEAHRARESDVLWSTTSYPLIEALWSRERCASHLSQNYPMLSVSKSGCFCCPYRGPKSWATLRRQEPELFEKARQMERNAAANGVTRGLWGERSIIAFDSDLDLTDFGLEVDDDLSCDPGGGCFI